MTKLPLLALLLLAFDPALLAPGPGELRAQTARLEAQLAEADAVGVAEARIHNRLAEGPLRQGRAALCEGEENRSLLARSRLFGAAYRDRVQSARASADRLRRMLAEPTLEPVLVPEERARAEALLARVEEHARRYGEMAAWQARHLEPALSRCRPALAPAPGLAGPRGAGTAVAGVGGGLVCPGNHPADGSVVVLPEPLACWDEASCRCAPMPVTPGAVLGR